MSTQRLLGRGRVLSIDRAGHTAVDKTSIHDDSNTDNTCICICNYGGFRDPLVVRREENGARKNGSLSRHWEASCTALVGKLMAYFDKS
jgi:hypothetical protein